MLKPRTFPCLLLGLRMRGMPDEGSFPNRSRNPEGEVSIQGARIRHSDDDAAIRRFRIEVVEPEEVASYLIVSYSPLCLRR